MFESVHNIALFKVKDNDAILLTYKDNDFVALLDVYNGLKDGMFFWILQG